MSSPLKEINITTPQHVAKASKPCYGRGLAVGLGGAIPEELLKFATIGAFISRGWVADPWAVVVYCFAIGATFGFLENDIYVAKEFLPPENEKGVLQRMMSIGGGRVFQAQTLMHGTCAIVTGLMFAQRKFLFWRQYGELKTCCEFSGPRPFYLIILPAIWIHFVNNFVVGAFLAQLKHLTEEDLETGEDSWVYGVAFIGLISNLVMAPLFAYYLFLTLKNVPRVNVIDLQKRRLVPKALSYICCWGACCKEERGQRDRRYVSILDMVGMKRMDQQQSRDQYLPPIMAES